ncbi:uncharacterized protein AKAME5_001683100 [Lates japonicus]|uniref:Uncharacterized protein n=1 Tax=Lates japonicus TaxID=270547 RepID=A0AAD3REC1_LATJO|nr:uncharacterized protein AKAME5_001683100 [Lates japonicus]
MPFLCGDEAISLSLPAKQEAAHLVQCLSACGAGQCAEIVPTDIVTRERTAVRQPSLTPAAYLVLIPRPPPLLYSNISLEVGAGEVALQLLNIRSEKAGEIATIPLTKIINERHSAYSWVAELIQVFIAISVTVSFLVMGSAMKHTIDGLVSSLWSRKLEWLSKAWERNLPNKQHICSARRHLETSASG